MAGIKDAIADVLARLSTKIDITTPEGIKNVRLWNEQITLQQDGQAVGYTRPNLYLEVLNEGAILSIGGGYDATDKIFRIHIEAEYFDGIGTYEADLLVFELRDLVINLLKGFKPAGCGTLVLTGEAQDYEHTNIYHYTVDFLAQFIDSTNSQESNLIDSPAPLDLQVTATYTNKFII